MLKQPFPQDQGLATQTRHLWRIDYLRGRKYLLVVSKEKPDPSALGRYGVPGTVEIRDYDPFLSRLQAGHIYRFRLVANPIYHLPVPGRKHDRHWAIVTNEEQVKWLEQRATRHGFHFLSYASGEAGKPTVTVLKVVPMYFIGPSNKYVSSWFMRSTKGFYKSITSLNLDLCYLMGSAQRKLLAWG